MIHLDEQSGTYVYVRYNQEELIFVALNISGQQKTVTAVFQQSTHTFHLAVSSGNVYMDLTGWA